MGGRGSAWSSSIDATCQSKRPLSTAWPQYAHVVVLIAFACQGAPQLGHGKSRAGRDELASILEFIRPGDVLVVTKSDLGQVATRARADLEAALRSLDSASAVVSVSSVAPPTGIEELVEALDAHRAGLDLPARRVRSRRMHALADYAAEYGDRGLRALGGRREAERWLAGQDARLDVAALRHALEDKAQRT